LANWLERKEKDMAARMVGEEDGKESEATDIGSEVMSCDAAATGGDEEEDDEEEEKRQEEGEEGGKGEGGEEEEPKEHDEPEEDDEEPEDEEETEEEEEEEERDTTKKKPAAAPKRKGKSERAKAYDKAWNKERTRWLVAGYDPDIAKAKARVKAQKTVYDLFDK